MVWFCVSNLISTEGDLRRPMTSDNHPSTYSIKDDLL